MAEVDLGKVNATEVDLSDDSRESVQTGKIAAQQGLLSVLDGRDYSRDTEEVLSSSDPWDTLQQKAHHKATQATVNRFTETGDVEGTLQEQARTAASGSSMLSTYKEALRNTDAMAGASEESLEKAAWGMTLNNIMSEVYDEEGYGGTALTVGGLFIPWRETTAIDTVEEGLANAGYLDDSSSWFTNQFTSGTALDRMHQVFSTLPSEEQVNFALTLKDLVKGATDNPMIGNGIFANIVKGDFSEATQNTLGALDTVLAPLEAPVIAKGFQKTMSVIADSGDLVKMAKDNESVELAELAVAASKDISTARAVGADPDKVADMLDLFAQGSYKELVEESDIPSQLAQKLDIDRVQMEERIKWHYRFTEEEGILSPEREREIMMLAEAKVRDDNVWITGMNVAHKDETGFRLEFDQWSVDEWGNPLVSDGVVEQNYVWSDLGELRLSDDSYNQFGLDPNTRLKGDLNSLVKDSERDIRAQGKASTLLNNLTSDALKKVPFGSKNKVMDKLQEGGENEEIYSYKQLKDEGWSDEAVEGYLNLRMVLDYQHTLKEKEMIKIYKANGVKFYDDGSSYGSQAVKAYNSPKEALADFRKDDFNYVGVEGEKTLKLGNADELTEDIVTDMYGKGYQLVSTDQINQGLRFGDQKLGWGFVRTVEDPSPGRTLAKVKGYFPRASDNGYYFLKKTTDVPIDGYKAKGVPITTTKTVAFSNGRKGLQAEMERLKAVNPDEVYEVVPDRQMPEMERARNVASTGGGLFTGKRATKQLQFIDSFGEMRKPSAGKMMERMNRHVSSVMATKLRNDRMEQHLVRSANSQYNFDAKNLDELETKVEYVPSATGKKQLKDAIRQVRAAKGMPSGFNRTISESYWALGEKMENVKGLPWVPHPSQLAYGLASGRFSVSDALRGAAFTCYLGMGNVSQLLVQGSGMFVAATANPIAFTKGMPSMVGAMILDSFSSNVKAQKQMLNYFRSTKGLESFADGYEMWRASGFHDSVLDMQSDALSLFNSGAHAHILNRGAAKANTFFYSQGELMTSRASFFTAMKHSEGKGMDVKKATAQDVENVSRRAEQYRLNMSRGNESVIQSTPGLNVMFQFWQVIHKFYTKILPKDVRIPFTQRRIPTGGTDEFSAYEKFRVGFATAAIMGPIAGIPMGDKIVNNILDVAGIDPTTVPEEEAVALRYGALGYLMRFGFGLENIITDRVSLGTDFLTDSYAAFTEQNFMRALLGASGGIVERAHNSIKLTSTVLKLEHDMEEEMTVQDYELMARTVFMSTSNLFTSTRNAQMYWANVFTGSDAVRNANGEYVLHSASMNDQTRIAAMFGMAPSELSELYELKFLNDKEKRPRGFSFDDSVDVMMQIANMAVRTDDKEEGEFLAKLGNQVMLSYPKDERYDLWQKAIGKIAYPQNFESNEVSKAFAEMVTKVEEGENKLSVLVSKTMNPSDMRDADGEL